jgi:hypothetical protein
MRCEDPLYKEGGVWCYWPKETSEKEILEWLKVIDKFLRFTGKWVYPAGSTKALRTTQSKFARVYCEMEARYWFCEWRGD